MKFLYFNPQLFTNNRQRFIKQMKANSIGIFHSNLIMPSNGDEFYTFKQNSNLYWLCGIQQENTKLVIVKINNKEYKEFLIISQPNHLKEIWDGKRLTIAQAQQISGIKTVIWVEQWESEQQKWIHRIEHIYLDTNENDRRFHDIETSEYLLINHLKRQFPLHNYIRAASIFKYLRSIKTPAEIALIKNSCQITRNTFLSLLSWVKPNIFEFEIEAHIVHSFMQQKAYPAYNSIIAAGDNARILHYLSNNQVCQSGDLILMDFGAEQAKYCADLTRTIPVNGKFTSRQKDVYNSCLRLHKYAKSILKPGIILKDYTSKVYEFANKEFAKIGLEIAQENGKKNPLAYQKYLYHGISHHLGIDVHDYGVAHLPLEPGMVLTVEPGIYIEEENMGIRLENNVLITKNGNLDLMSDIPIEIKDLEFLMKK